MEFIVTIAWSYDLNQNSEGHNLGKIRAFDVMGDDGDYSSQHFSDMSTRIFAKIYLRNFLLRFSFWRV